jgi:hypothetical protein
MRVAILLLPQYISRECLLSFSQKSFVFPSHIKKNLKIKIYKTVILPVVLYGCETWSLTLGEEYRVRDSKVKRPLGRPRRRWEDNIKLYLRKIGIDGANWIQLAQDRVQWRAYVNTVMSRRVP